MDVINNLIGGFMTCLSPYNLGMAVLGAFPGELDAPHAVVHPSATVHPSAQLMPSACIGPGAEVGPRTIVFPGARVGQDAKVGADCLVYHNVVIRERCVVGDRVILQPGCVIGSDGFGYALDMAGDGHGPRHFKVPQVGIVVIEDDVEIGANSCVDRATLGVTRICRGAKIDNLVQIAHNVEIGPLTIVPAADEERNPIETTRRGVIGVTPMYVPATVVPVRPGAAGPVEPFDLVVRAGGRVLAVTVFQDHLRQDRSGERVRHGESDVNVEVLHVHIVVGDVGRTVRVLAALDNVVGQAADGRQNDRGEIWLRGVGADCDRRLRAAFAQFAFESHRFLRCANRLAFQAWAGQSIRTHTRWILGC